MNSVGHGKGLSAFLIAPAFALTLLACGGDPASDSSVEVASAQAQDVAATAPVGDAAALPEAPSASSDNSDAAPAPATAAATATPGDETADEPAAEPTSTEIEAESAAAVAATPSIPQLSATEAIANAEANIGALQTADNVLDIETLAVGDGSIHTLRDVVIGDRPVLLWFFSPH